MARTAIPITDIEVTGTALPAQTAGDTVNHNSFGPNDGQVWLEVENASTSATEKFTLVIPGTVDGIAIEDKELEVPKEATRIFGPFPPSDFNNEGDVYVNPASAELKFRAFRL